MKAIRITPSLLDLTSHKLFQLFWKDSQNDAMTNDLGISSHWSKYLSQSYVKYNNFDYEVKIEGLASFLTFSQLNRVKYLFLEFQLYILGRLNGVRMRDLLIFSRQLRAVGRLLDFDVVKHFIIEAKLSHFLEFEKKQICIIGIDSLISNLEYIQTLYNNKGNNKNQTGMEFDFILLDNKCPIEYLWKQLDGYGFDKMKCYSLIDVSSDLLVSYFKTMYLSTEQYEIIDNGYIDRPKYNTGFSNRSQAINSLTKPDAKYLEIGVEYGETFLKTHFKDENKTGVDPDPKFDIIGKKFKFETSTSDDYFKDRKVDSLELKVDIDKTFDVIFIDGMHQSEYFLRDFNNSVKVLKNNGSIFIDDILPLTYNEQLKIPRKHYYENGILKYGEEWTGDIWKVVYHILKNYSHNLLLEETKYFYNANYRGVLHLKLKEEFEIADSELETINGYNYFTDFPKYLELIATYK